MNPLKEIVEKLEYLPESDLQEVFDFVDSLVTAKEHTLSGECNQRQTENNENYSVEWIEGVLVVQGERQEDWESSDHELREERIRHLAQE